MIRLMKKKIPAAKIDIACMFDGVSYVFKNNPHIHKIHRLSLYYENKLIGLKQLLSLRNNKYDISILAFPSYRREYHIVQSLVAAANRISHRFKKGYLSEFNFLDTHSIEVDEKVHNVINNLNILKYFSIDWQKEIDENNLSYDFTINQDDDNFGIKYIHNLKWTKQDIVGFHPGSISSKAGILKRWPIENFAGLGKLLIKKNKKILIFIGPEEIGLGKALIRLIDDVSGCHLLENMKFHQTIGILNNIGKLITNDNGFAHLSNGLRISSIVLFGPTEGDSTASRDKKRNGTDKNPPCCRISTIVQID
ncbi:MAG: Lipopolysaccharide core biosynthesis protein rfaq [Candidatus Roizmanbacteria bacterium GW2011_GWA2_36_23]|uniref:Lipopolysaccharide core biosynthesis protein rfaq n=1 Tax=Candidatus Roizmanbacteria bacterium GW2011_GWA2_36_23 TaxID=1618480 RepID=A0A0G0E8A4_9BACT|nr:MAG: Lipopolysaccharide core biosynthesis protein rfaq [Candidatus Roizmanbacteria bacterium GW2011_GWA2_36_23]